MNTAIKILFALILISSCYSPQKNLPAQFDTGTIEKNVYKNKYFDLQIEFPPDWNIIKSEELEFYWKQKMENKINENFLPEYNRYAQNMLETTMNNSSPLLSLYKNKIEDVLVFYPSFLVSVLNVKGDGLDQTAKGYLFDIRRFKKENGGKEIETGEEFYWKEIGGERFEAIWWIDHGIEPAIMQETFVRKTNDLLLFINLTYSTSDEKAELYDILDRIKKIENYN